VKSIHVRRLESRVATTAARLVAHVTANRIPVAELPQVRLPWYEIRNQAAGGAGGSADDVPTVFIFDEIGGSLGVSAKRFVAELEEIDAPLIKVRINSPGGSVFDAIAIHSALLHHSARIQVYVDGYAASAASVIAMAGDEVIMMPGSQLMIHDASMVEDGNAADHAKASTFLDRESDNIAGMYQRRGGGEVGEWRALMFEETWMFADEAVEMKLADRTEHARPVLDPVLQERMSRTFDVSGRYRYASRAAAPAPARGKAPHVRRSQPARVEVRESREEQLRNAAQRRAEAMGNAQRVAPPDPPNGEARTVSTAWMHRSGGRQIPGSTLALPPRLKAPTLQERDGKQFYVVEGYYTVYERGYEMWDEHGPYIEVVSSGAGDKTTAANPDVIFLVNHRGLAMARSIAGTLELWSDTTGGGDRAWLNPQRQDVKDLVLGIDDKTITEQSFSFLIEAGRWNSDFSQYRIDLYNLDRGDTSAVNYGANPQTSIAARAREILDELDHLPAGAARAALDRLHGRSDLQVARSAMPVPVTEPNLDLGGRSMTSLEAWLATVAAG
jgi:HK97 family phage prohead protease